MGPRKFSRLACITSGYDRNFSPWTRDDLAKMKIAASRVRHSLLNVISYNKWDGLACEIFLNIL
jgi:hypothetical protein